jgi:hypothetical protein
MNAHETDVQLGSDYRLVTPKKPPPDAEPAISNSVEYYLRSLVDYEEVVDLGEVFRKAELLGRFRNLSRGAPAWFACLRRSERL